MKAAVHLLVIAWASLVHADDLGRPLQAPIEVTQVVADTDALIVSGLLEGNAGAGRGGGGAIDWVRTRADGTTLSAGLAHYAFPTTQWTLARGGAGRRFDDGLILQGEVSAGGGRGDGGNFSYLIVLARLYYQVAPALYLGVEDRYVDIAAAHGHLPKVSALIVASPAVSADLGYSRSVGGNLDSDFFSARIDWQTPVARLFGGVVSGNIAPPIVNVDVGATAPSGALREWFVGLAVPISRFEVTMSVDMITLSDTRRQIITLGVRIPIGGA